MPSALKNLLLVGGNGMLARAIASRAPVDYLLTSVDLPDFDVTDEDQVAAVITALQPEVIINCAAYTNVDGCETEQVLATQVNGVAVGYLAKAARNVDATLVHISTDYVFDGNTVSTYVESDKTNPQSVYGHSKLIGEQAVIDSQLEKYFIVRTSWLYGPGGNNFVETILRLAAEREELRIISDQVGSPTFSADLADAIFMLLAASTSLQHPPSSPFGIYHFANSGHCSWYEFACAIVEEGRNHKLPLKVREVHPISTDEYPLPAKRPANSVFDKEKYKAMAGTEIPGWRDSLKIYFTQREQHK